MHPTVDFFGCTLARQASVLDPYKCALNKYREDAIQYDAYEDGTQRWVWRNNYGVAGQGDVRPYSTRSCGPRVFPHIIRGFYLPPNKDLGFSMSVALVFT